MEYHYIKQYHSHVRENGYNMTWGGEGTHGYKHTEETKKKFSHMRKNKFKGKNNPRYNDHRSYEDIHGKEKSLLLKQKVSDFHKNRPKSKEWKQKMSNRVSGKNNPMYGKTGKLNKSSKTYKVIDDNGNEYIVTGLNSFCIQHKLNVKALYALASGKRKYYKGYSCIKISLDTE